VEGTVTHRIANARAKLGSRVLSETNSAYDKGRGMCYVSERAVQLFEEMYTGMRNCVATTHGRTDLFPREGTGGVGQGAMSSPEISKFAQDPFLRSLEGRLHLYETAKGTRVSNAGYSDDHVIIIPEGEAAMKEFREVTTSILPPLGIGLKMGKTDTMSNETNPREVVIGFADRAGGGVKEGRITPTSFDRTSKLLGVRKNGLGNSGGQVVHLARIVHFVLANLTKKQADWREIHYVVKTVLVNMLTYAPVHSRIRAPALHQWDIQLARVVRTALRATQTTCRQGLYARKSRGGLQMSSLVAERWLQEWRGRRLWP
jgi:hypothetical protein